MTPARRKSAAPKPAKIVFVGEIRAVRAAQALEAASGTLDAALGYLEDFGTREDVRRLVQRAQNILDAARNPAPKLRAGRRRAANSDTP